MIYMHRIRVKVMGRVKCWIPLLPAEPFGCLAALLRHSTPVEVLFLQRVMFM